MSFFSRRWARKHRDDLRKQNIEIEFELVRLQYVDLLESCAEAVDALHFATERFTDFHDTHAKGPESGCLLACGSGVCGVCG